MTVICRAVLERLPDETGDCESEMLKDELHAMPLDELWLLHEQITKVLSDRITAEKNGLEERLAKLNSNDANTKLNLKLASGRPRRKYPKVFPKYRNPTSPSETWSGRGKRPRWLIVALQNGHKIEDLKIDQEDKVNSLGGIERERN